MVMSLTNLFKKQRHKPEALISQHIPIANFVTPSLIESPSGDLAGIIRLEGYYCETATTAKVNAMHRAWTTALSRLGSEFGLFSYVMRKGIQMELSGDFHSYLGKALDRDYHARYKDQDYYRNEIYICVVYKGFDSGKLGKSFSWLSKLSRKKIVGHREAFRAQAIVKTTNKIKELVSLLSSYKPYWLNQDVLSNGHNEVLSFLSDLVNGVANRNLSNFHGFSKVSQALYAPSTPEFPSENLANYLGTHSVFFGDRIQFSDGNGHNKFAAIITLKDLKGSGGAAIPQLNPTTMVSLMRLPMEFIYFTAFLPEATDVALTMIERQEKRFEGSKDASITQKMQLHHLKDDLASERSTLGATQTQLMIISDSLESLAEKINLANKCLVDAGISGVIESFNQEACFWSMVPFNHHYFSRIRYLQSNAYADLFPMTNYPIGHWNKNHLGSAVTLVDTHSATPMFFHFHKTGSYPGGTPTVGHSLIVGKTGSGKSVFIGFMLGQLERYNTRVIAIDFDCALEVPIRAYGGDYFRLSPDFPEYSKFNPFSLEDTAANRTFLKNWLLEMVRLDDETLVPGAIEKELSACVDYAYERLAPNERYLTNVLARLPVNFSRRHELDRWTRANKDNYNDGMYAYLFDNNEDGLSLKNRLVGFDFTALFQQGLKVISLVSMYLFHCIESSLDGSPVSIWCDEAHRIVDFPYFSTRIKEWLAQLRKLNTFITFATQLPETFLASKISSTLIGNTHTHIFLPSTPVDYKHYAPFNVTPEEFEFIQNTTDHGYFLYKFGHESTICRLNLSGMDYYLNIFGADKIALKVCNEARLEMGERPEDWLPLYQEKLLKLRTDNRGGTHAYISN
jgi:type IV secretion system protein VirB4